LGGKLSPTHPLWAKQTESQKKDDRATVVQTLKHWQEDPDLIGVRDKSALEKLPDDERAEWEKLWADVAELLEKVQEQKQDSSGNSKVPAGEK
jgi:hypothetical protein